MTPSHNSINGNDFSVPSALACRACDRKKACVCVKGSQWSEPLNVSEWMRVHSKLGWHIENQSNLCDAKTFIGKKRVKLNI